MRGSWSRVIVVVVLFAAVFFAAADAPCAAPEGDVTAVEVSPADLFYFTGLLSKRVADKAFGEKRPGWFNRLNYGFSFREDLKPEFYAETVYPVAQDEERKQTVFLQPRASYNSTDDDVYNLGLGVRRYWQAWNVLSGWTCGSIWTLRTWNSLMIG